MCRRWQFLSGRWSSSSLTGCPGPYPADGAAQNLADTLADLASAQAHWSLFLKDGGTWRDDRSDQLWPDDGVSREMRGFWLDLCRGAGLMTEAADRVTDYAFDALGWPHLWLSNAEPNRASAAVKERQGATLVDTTPVASSAAPFPARSGCSRRKPGRRDRTRLRGDLGAGGQP